MKQYTQSRSLPVSKPIDHTPRDLTESQQRISLLENRIQALSSTVDLQTRQIRRLEAALHQLESRAVSR